MPSPNLFSGSLFSSARNYCQGSFFVVLIILIWTSSSRCSEPGRHAKYSHHHRSSIDSFYSVTHDSGPGGWIAKGPQSTIAPARDEVMFTCELSLTAEGPVTWLHQPEGMNKSEGDYTELNVHAELNKDGYQLSSHGMGGSLRVLADHDRITGSGKFRCSARFGPLALVSTPARLELATLENFRLDDEWIASQRDGEGLRLRAPVGSRVMMRCPDVISSPQAVIQFYKYNRPLPPKVPQLPSGAIVLESVTTEDSGRYTCSALNELNDEVAPTTLAFSLDVYRPEQREPPRFLQPLRSLYTVAAGTRVLLECVGVGEPIPKVQWSKQGGIIGHTERSKDIMQRADNRYSGMDPIQIRNGKYRSSSDLYETSDQTISNGADGQTTNMPRILNTEYGLLIENTTLQDTGLYECALIDPSRRYPPVKQQIRLDVESAPEFPENILGANTPQQFNLSLFVKEGTRLELHCSAYGVPPPKIYWMLNARPAEKEPNVLVDKGRMVIDPVSREHAGAVQCFAANKIGERYRAGVLSVTVPEVTGEAESGVEQGKINSAPNKMNQRKHGESGDGRGHPHHHRNKEEQHQNGNRANNKRNKGPQIKNGHLPTIRNKKGNRNAEMIPPSRPNVTRLSDESVMVRWSVPDNNGLKISFFKVQYKDLTTAPQTHTPRTRKGWITTNDEIPSHIRSYEVNNLESNHSYKFHIAAVYSNNDNKQGPNSEKFHLKRGEFLGKSLLPSPVLLRTETLGPTVIQIHWQYTPDPTRPADGFYLYFRPASTAGEYVKATVDGEQSRIHRIEHLIPDTTYEVKVQSFTANGASDFSAILTQRTMKLTTEPPTPMVILEHGSSLAAAAATSSGSSSSSVVTINDTADKGKNHQSSSSSGALAVGGGTAGGLAAVLVLAAAGVYALRKKQKNKNVRTNRGRNDDDEDGRRSCDNKDNDPGNNQEKSDAHIQESNGYITASAINPHNSYQLKTVQISANGCARVNITSNPLAEEQSDKNASVTLTELEMEMSMLSQNNNMSGSSSGSATTNSGSTDKRQFGNVRTNHSQQPHHKKMLRNGGLPASRRNEVNMNSNSSIENYV